MEIKLTKRRFLKRLLLTVMRIFIFLICTSVFSLAPVNVISQNAKIKIDENKTVTVDEVFDIIKSQTKAYMFIYPEDMFKDFPKVQLKKGTISMDKLINQSLAGGNLNVILTENNTILIKEAKTQQPIQISGKVTDEDGLPVSGASVIIKGTTKGVAADFDGVYNITVPNPENVLVFSAIGFETKEITVGTQTTINVVLKTSVSALDEVVITGYQTLKKERAAGSFAKPKLEVVENRTNSMNVLDRLDGLVPGLTINKAPGAESVLIRGLSSINATRSPLYVVDGMQMNDISSINPLDIEDITVLKDAMASSIWGSRASNGVIVITTKRGKVGEKIRVTYDTFTNMQGKPDLGYLPGLSSKQFIETAKEIFDPVTYPASEAYAYANLSSDGVAPHEDILYNQYLGNITDAQANAMLNNLASINNLKQISDLWYRNAYLMNHTLSLSGGSNAYSFYGSFSYTDTHSNRPGEKNNTYKVNLRQDLNLNKNIHLYLITDLNKNNTEAKRNINIGNRFYPYQLFRDGAGNNISIPYMQYFSEQTRQDYEAISGINLDYNPLDEFNYGYTKGDALLARITGGLTLDLLPGLKFEGVYGYIKGNTKTKTYDDAKSYLVRSEAIQFTVADGSGDPVYYLPTTGGKYSIDNLNTSNWVVRNQLTYEKNFMDKHLLTLLLGQEAQEQLTTTNGSTVRGYNEDLQTYSALDYATLGTIGLINPVVPNTVGVSILNNDFFSESESRTRFTSYYANLAYTYDKKYSVNGSWRIDRSNLFGLDKSAQAKPVWSLGLKWLVSNEGFMENSSWIDHMALRATYGITGNAPAPGTASSYDIVKADNAAYWPNGVGSIIASPANAKLTWESSKTLNAGLDFSLLNNKLSGSIDVYTKKTTDLIGRFKTNIFTGYASTIGNFGDMENKGIELGLTSVNIQNKNFSWASRFVLSYNKNKITKLDTQIPVTTGNQKIGYQFLPGYSAFAVFAYKYAGLDDTGDPQIVLADGSITKAPNATLAEDVVYKGTTQPVWNGGFTNTLQYKGFVLSANIVYSLGHVMRRPVNTFYTGRLTHSNVSYFNTYWGGNVSAEFYDRWKNPGDENITDIPSYEPNSALSRSRRDVGYYINGDLNVVSASSIKLRDITLSYSLPESVLNQIKADEITLRLQMSNIMLWKANKYGIDPEFIGSMPTNQNSVALGLRVAF